MGWDDGIALHDWCEPNYVHTKYVAETWNTITAAPYVLIGLATTCSNWGNPVFARLRYAGAALILVGLGTADYHGTLTRRGQAIDELAILYWEIALLFTVFENFLKTQPLYNYAIVALFVLENLMYFQMDAYPTAISLPSLHPCGTVITTIGVAVFPYMFGDMFLCDMTQRFHLHAWGWHIFSSGAIACLHIGLAVQICRQNKKSKVQFLGFDVGDRS